MIFTDYYSFQKLPDQKSKYRRDAVASTGSYPQLEQLRNKQGKLFAYLGGVPDSFNAIIKAKATLSLTKTTNITSIIVPDVAAMIGYGDFKGTADAMIFVFVADYTGFELFIARGMKAAKQALAIQVADGDADLLAEMQALRQAAKPE